MTFVDVVYYNGFPTTGPGATVLGAEFERYNSTPGNAGFGVRSEDQLEVIDNTAAGGWSTEGAPNDNVLRITAENVGGEHYHGGFKLAGFPMTYGQIETRVRISTDTDAITSGVVIFWPEADPVRFPDSNNASGVDGESPAGGEIDGWEATQANAVTRTPLESFVHRLNPTATIPYTPADDEVVASRQYAGVDASVGQKIVISWTPDEIYVEIDNGAKQVITDNPAHIPDWPMAATWQLDAWSDTPPTTPVTMDIDYVLLRAYTPPPPAPTAFPRARLGTRFEMAFGAGDTNPLEWSWTDITPRVQGLDQRIPIKSGRSDESSTTTPASLSVVADNGDAGLTPGYALSPYWPNVTRHTPFRMWVEGAEAALVLRGEAGSFASTPDHFTYDIAGPIDVRASIDPEQWSTGIVYAAGAPDTFSRPQPIMARFDPGDLSWSFVLTSGGRPYWVWSPNGSSILALTVDRFIAALHPIAVGCTFEPDNGAGGHTATFYRWDGPNPPADITEWSLVGSSTGAGTTTVNAGASTLTIGQQYSASNTHRFRGRHRWAELRDGINGTLVTAPNFAAQTPGTTAFDDILARTWTLNGAAEISTDAVRLVGNVDDYRPSWPHGDNAPLPAGTTLADRVAAGLHPSEARVSMSVAGLLRRLTQGAKPVRSSLYRHVVALQNIPHVLAYWPCEDPTEAIGFGSAIPAAAGMAINGRVDTGVDDSLLASGPLPTISSGDTATLTGPVAPDVGATAWAVEFVFNIPTPETEPTRTPLVTVVTAGTARTWRLEISATGLRIVVTGPEGSTLVDVLAGISDIDDRWMLARLEAAQSGPDIAWSWNLVELDTGEIGGVSGTFTGTIGHVGSVENTTVGPPQGMSFGHFIVSDGTLPTGWLAGADTAWVGESAAHRFARLCYEEQIPVEVVGDPTVVPGVSTRGDLTLSEPMGPQERRPLVELLEQCVATDLGVMFERRTAPGLVYRTRQTLQNQTPALELDAAYQGRGDIVNPFEPVLDDQRHANDVEVRSAHGSAARLLDVANIAAEGLYDIEVTIGGVGGVAVQRSIVLTQPGLQASINDQNRNQAGWRLYLGTWPGMRYPSVAVDLAIAEHLIAAWHELALGDRVTVVNLPAQHPANTVDLIVEAIDEHLSPTQWGFDLTCSPGGPWQIGVLDS